MTRPAPTVTVPDFQHYRRSQIAHLRPYIEGETLSDRVSISAADLDAGSPKRGDMIARNPANHDDQWLVAADYFAANFEPAAPAAPQAAGVGEPTPEQLEPFARKWCEANGIDPDAPKAPHGEWPEWYDACGPFAAMWRDISAHLRTPSREPEGGAVDARAVAKILNPALFSHDKVEAHRAASPYTVTSARIDAVDSVRKVLDAAALATREEAPACEMCNGRGEVGGPTGQTPESFDYVTERCPDCGGTGKVEAPADHHERNLSMTNDELIGQALSHLPLEAPAEAGERDKRAWIDRWNAIEAAARDALHTMNELLEAPNLKRMQYALAERRDALSVALNLPEAGTAWMRPTALRAQPQAREDATPSPLGGASVGPDEAEEASSVYATPQAAQQNDLGTQDLNRRLEALQASEDPQPVGWLRAADEEMVSAHLGVAEAEDSYETAKKKLASLIQWNIAVAMDPSVGGHSAPDALREASLWWNAEDWEQTFDNLEDAYDAATGGEMRGVAKLGRATEHDPVWALRIDLDTTGNGETDDYEIRLFKSVGEAHAYLAALQAGQGAK